LEGVDAKVWKKRWQGWADVGCGLGAINDIDGENRIQNPNSSVFDYHDKSIETATKTREKTPGVADRIRFEIAKAKDYPGKDYDFCDLFSIACTTWGDPAGASGHVRQFR